MNRRLPPAHGVIPPAPPIPPEFGPVTHAQPPPLPPPPPPPENSVDFFPLYFWPSKPWDVEPFEDDSLAPGITIESIRQDREHRALWTATNPFMWPEQDEDRWKFAKFLGAGSFVAAGLWCQVDETDNIIKQMVVKEVCSTTRLWRDPIDWRGKLPREIRMHQLIDANRRDASNPDHEHRIEHYGYRLVMEQQRYRIFLKYYEGADLEVAFRDDCSAMELRHHANAQSSGDAPGWEWDEEPHCYRVHGKLPELIGEALIWKMLSDLVTGCQIMQYGQPSQDGVQERMDGWKPITHRDLRSDNIFVLSPEKKSQGENNEEFPTFVIADLGNALTEMECTDPQPSDNPTQYVLNKQYSATPPELQFAIPDEAEGHVLVPISEKTDVWTLGSIVYFLIAQGTHDVRGGPRRQRRPGSLITDFFAGPNGDLGPTNDENVNPFLPKDNFPTFYRYSKELRSLVAHCLTWQPHQRPTLLDIRKRIDGFLATNPDNANDRRVRPLKVKREKKFSVGRQL